MRSSSCLKFINAIENYTSLHYERVKKKITISEYTFINDGYEK